MSAATILIVGVSVFGLLLIGLFLTLVDAQRESNRPDLIVGVDPNRITDEDELAARGAKVSAADD